MLVPVVNVVPLVAVTDLTAVPVVKVVTNVPHPCMAAEASDSEATWMWVCFDAAAKMEILETNGHMFLYYQTGEVNKTLAWASVKPTKRDSNSDCLWCGRQACSHGARCSRKNFACKYCHWKSTSQCCVNSLDWKKIKSAFCQTA